MGSVRLPKAHKAQAVEGNHFVRKFNWTLKASLTRPRTAHDTSLENPQPSNTAQDGPDQLSAAQSLLLESKLRLRDLIHTLSRPRPQGTGLAAQPRRSTKPRGRKKQVVPEQGFDPTHTQEDLLARMRSWVQSMRPKNTTKSYSTCGRHFKDFCHLTNRQHLPASPASVVACIKSCNGRKQFQFLNNQVHAQLGVRHAQGGRLAFTHVTSVG